VAGGEAAYFLRSLPCQVHGTYVGIRYCAVGNGSSRQSVKILAMMRYSSWGTGRLSEAIMNDPHDWFAKEKGVYCAVCWVPPALLLLQIAIDILPFPADIQVAALLLLPYGWLLTSAALCFWGATLLVLGLLRHAHVGLLAVATAVSSLPLLLVAVLLMFLH